MNLWTVAAIIIALNVHFGYWRENVENLSFQWFLSIHAPVPLIIVLRIFSGLGWHFITFAVLIGAFFLGHIIGGKLSQALKIKTGWSVSSCLVMDFISNMKRLQG